MYPMYSAASGICYGEGVHLHNFWGFSKTLRESAGSLLPTERTVPQAPMAQQFAMSNT